MVFVSCSCLCGVCGRSLGYCVPRSSWTAVVGLTRVRGFVPIPCGSIVYPVCRYWRIWPTLDSRLYSRAGGLCRHRSIPFATLQVFTGHVLSQQCKGCLAPQRFCRGGWGSSRGFVVGLKSIIACLYSRVDSVRIFAYVVAIVGLYCVS